MACIVFVRDMEPGGIDSPVEGSYKGQQGRQRTHSYSSTDHSPVLTLEVMNQFISDGCMCVIMLNLSF